MIRHSKPLGRLLDFKQDFFARNDARLEELKTVSAFYRSQPRRNACKNCAGPLVFSPSTTFTHLQVEYALCPHCGHLNGAHEDTDAFGRFLYTGNGCDSYAREYGAGNAARWKDRVAEIYRPKAEFLKDALVEAGAWPARLVDFGAGAGHFVSAALDCGFDDVIGYEVSGTLVAAGQSMLGKSHLQRMDLDDIARLTGRVDATVACFIGVLEHLQKPREVLEAVRHNSHIRHVFILLPMFSPAVAVQSAFPEVAPRLLTGGHTHLYTESSIQYLCDEFGFARQSEWWFGADMLDLYRSMLLTLNRSAASGSALRPYWEQSFLPLVDGLQHVLDEAHLCSEVHMLLEKRC